MPIQRSPVKKSSSDVPMEQEPAPQERPQMPAPVELFNPPTQLVPSSSPGPSSAPGNLGTSTPSAATSPGGFHFSVPAPPLVPQVVQHPTSSYLPPPPVGPAVDLMGDVDAMHAAPRLQLQPFWKEDPNAWFFQAEAQFLYARIRSDASKFQLIIGALPREAVTTLSRQFPDLSNPPSYAVLKQYLLGRYSMTETQRIEALLSNQEIGDMKPSDFYLSMRETAGSTTAISDQLIFKLWLRRLPQAVQVAVVALEGKTIDQILSTADKVWEVLPRAQVHASTAGSSDGFAGAPTRKDFDQLKSLVVSLSREVKKFARPQGMNSPRSRSNSRARPQRQQSRTRPQNTTSNQPSSSSGPSNESGKKLCFYHSRYGQKATQCKKPCQFFVTPAEQQKN